MAQLHELIILFFVAVFSASVLPSQAELVLFAFLAIGKESALLLIVAATAGNTLGSLANYYLGRSILHWQDRKWFPFKPKYMRKPRALFEKHGHITLLLAGVPFIGNPITVTAGMLQVPLCIFIPLVAAGKGLRYILVWLIYVGMR
ncbi:MAG: DedA family protein [Elusimicrobiaceae bacterium]|nr:DedA family protein [Elusimicrobiaceae bacterium]